MMHDIRRVWGAVPRIGRRKCVMCGRRVGAFLPFRGGRIGLPPLLAAIDIVGSDVDNFECPRCGAHDRERHLLLYFKATGLLDSLPSLRVLHFAPERRLAQRIAAATPLQYLKCDLHPRSGDVQQVDIEAMTFSDSSFDLVIANHVLEHVTDDRRAVREVYRVLRPGGSAILQTPYSACLRDTWSDPGIVTDEARLQAYGQEDHVRLFGRDVFDRIAASGLQSCMKTHADLLGDYDAQIYGVNHKEPFFLFRRTD